MSDADEVEGERRGATCPIFLKICITISKGCFGDTVSGVFKKVEKSEIHHVSTIKRLPYLIDESSTIYRFLVIILRRRRTAASLDRSTKEQKSIRSDQILLSVTFITAVQTSVIFIWDEVEVRTNLWRFVNLILRRRPIKSCSLH